MGNRDQIEVSSLSSDNVRFFRGQPPRYGKRKYSSSIMISGRKFFYSQSLGKGSYGNSRVYRDSNGNCIVVKKERRQDPHSRKREYSTKKEFFDEYLFLRQVFGSKNVYYYQELDCSEDTRYQPCYIAMPYIKGDTLYDTINRYMPRNWQDDFLHLIDCLIAAAKTLQQLHQKHKIVHGDVKARNIIITNKKGNIEAHYIDFGLSREPNEQTSGLSNSCYMAPELKQKVPAHHKQDIYSLGGMSRTLHKLLKLPHNNEEERIDCRLIKLNNSLLSNEPNNRPELAEVIRELEQIQYAAENLHHCHPHI